MIDPEENDPEIVDVKLDPGALTSLQASGWEKVDES